MPPIKTASLRLTPFLTAWGASPFIAGGKVERSRLGGFANGFPANS